MYEAVLAFQTEFDIEPSLAAWTDASARIRRSGFMVTGGIVKERRQLAPKYPNPGRDEEKEHDPVLRFELVHDSAN